MDALSEGNRLAAENRLKEILTEAVTSKHLEESFAGFLLPSEEISKQNFNTIYNELVRFWQSKPAGLYDSMMKVFVSVLHSQKNAILQKTLTDLLKSLVDNNIISAKLVCETLLTSEKLSYSNPEVWCYTLKLVRQLVGGAGYKGCRDCLRFLLEHTQTIPISDNVSAKRLLNVVYDVISYILDRKVCLLPSYFAVNEITKLFSEDRPWPHWKLGQLLADFVQSFRPAAQMVTVCGRSKLVPVVGHSISSSNVWRLNTNTLRFTLNGPLPYDKELSEPQTMLLRYVLEQPYSRDMVCSMLSLNKQVKLRCSVLEEQLVNLVVVAMERSEEEDPTETALEGIDQLWQHLSSQLIFFVLFQFASFPHMVLVLYEKLKSLKLRRGRDYLMWILLQFISGSIQKNPLEDFLPVMKLYDLLYPEVDMIPVPDINKPLCTLKMAATCIWIHLSKKALGEKVPLQRPVPRALTGHIDFLKQCLAIKTLTMSDYKIALLCNAYSTNSDYFVPPMTVFVETIYGNNQKTTLLPGNVSAFAPTQPLAMDMLDSLTVHAKMSLIHGIVTRVIRLAQSKQAVALAPALVETYSRLLVYIEIESLGIKGFISQLLPSVYKANAWGTLHTLLEMFCYRLHHIQPHYRIQLLSQLHTLAQASQTNQYQLYLCVESTALHLIMGLGSWEVQPQLSRMFSEPKAINLLSSESEELNRAMVLTLARAMHVTGSESFTSTWCKDVLTSIMNYTPHSWSSHTLACFPPALQEFFQHSMPAREDKSVLRRNVETEYRLWKSMATEQDLISHFSTPTSPALFICVLWKTLQEDNRIAPMAYKVLERLGPRALANQLRTFADYLVFEFTGMGQQVNKCVDSLNDLIWRCSIVPLDRLVLCLALRSFEGSEAQVGFFIIQLLLLRNLEFRNRVADFVKENSPEHWLQNNWHDKHMAFHKKFPEKYYFEGVVDMTQQQQPQYLPIYFGNICLRFLPVFDIVIHRFLELPPVSKSLENLLEHLGTLYKFHDRPLTYLYSTLHYYEKKLKDRPSLKKKLVAAIIGSLKDLKPEKWCLTDDYLLYLQQTQAPEESSWVPDQDYYIRLIGRLVDTIAGKPAFPSFDWRFNEFPNQAAHALYATAIELMALPVVSQVVGRALFDIILKGMILIPRDKIFAWMNAIGLVVTSLPEGYWIVLNECIMEAIVDPHLSNAGKWSNPFQMFNFNASHQVLGEVTYSYVLALCHAVWEHASIGQLSQITAFMKESLKPIVQTEEQFLFVCHMVGPFLQRFHLERTRCMLEVTVELYEMLEKVDRSVEDLRFMDSISDFLYHIKYMFVGDGVKNEVEKVIRNLRLPLQLRLQFISHHSKDESASVGSAQM